MRIKNTEIITKEDLLFLDNPSFFKKNNIYKNMELKSDLILKKSENLIIIKYRGYFLIYTPLERNRQVVLINDYAKDILDLCDGNKNITEIFYTLSSLHYKINDKDIFNLMKGYYHPKDIFKILIFQKTPLTFRDLNLILYYFQKYGLVFNPSKISNLNRACLRNVAPLSFWLHLTNQCNFRCRYCYVHKSKQKMSFKIAKEIINFLFYTAKSQERRIIQLRFGGGEPLLESPLLLKIADYAIEKSRKEQIGLELLLLTNGSLINSKIIEELKKRQIFVSLSLDGLKDFHDVQRVYPNQQGTFKDVERALNILTRSEIRFSVLITISSSNIRGLPALVSYLLNKNIKFMFNFVRPTNFLEQSAKNFVIKDDEVELFIEYLIKSYQQIRKRIPRYPLANNILSVGVKPLGSGYSFYSCQAGRNFWAIDCNGKIFPCHMMIGIPKYRFFSLGKVKKNEDFNKLLDKMRQKGKQIEINPFIEKKENCRDCIYRYCCGGACSMATYNTYGRFDISSPFCSIIKTLIPEVLKIEGDRLLKYKNY